MCRGIAPSWHLPKWKDTANESDSSAETITVGSTKTVTENTEGSVTETQQTLGSKVGSTIGATLSIIPTFLYFQTQKGAPTACRFDRAY